MANPAEIFKKVQSTTADGPDVVILNDQRYWIEIVVDDGSNKTHIPNSLISEIKIMESLFHFETYAQITYHDPSFTFSNLFSLLASKFGCDQQGNENDPRYSFKGNNKEKLHVKIVPMPDGTDAPPLRPDIWHIQHEFAIAGVTNMGSGNTNNHLKLHCVDYMWNELKSIKPDDWVCGREGGNKYRNEGQQLKHVPTYPREDIEFAKALKTGEGVYAAIERAGLIDHLPLIDEGASQGEKRLVLDQSELEPLGEEGQTLEEEDVWDFGSEEHRVFTSSVNDWMCLDFLEYYLNWHGSGKTVTEQGYTSAESEAASLDPCFLVLERPKEENGYRKFSLKSLLHYFQNAGNHEPGEYHRENFFIKESQGFDVDNPIFQAIRSPLGAFCGESEKGISSRETVTINDYQTVAIEGSDSRDYLRTHIASLNDGIDKAYALFKSTPEQVKEYVAENYLPNLKTAGGAAGVDNILFRLNRDKIENREDLTFRIQIPTKSAGVVASRNRLLMAVIFLNRCMNWSVQGSTHRQSGRFCGIDRLDSEDDSDFDNEILGQYFIVNTVHQMNLKEKSYRNELTGVKFFAYKPPEQTVAINTTGSRSKSIEDSGGSAFV